jgi:hypothetical protein
VTAIQEDGHALSSKYLLVNVGQFAKQTPTPAEAELRETSWENMDFRPG